MASQGMKIKVPAGRVLIGNPGSGQITLQHPGRIVLPGTRPEQPSSAHEPCSEELDEVVSNGLPVGAATLGMGCLTVSARQHGMGTRRFIYTRGGRDDCPCGKHCGYSLCRMNTFCPKRYRLGAPLSGFWRQRSPQAPRRPLHLVCFW